MGSVSLCLGQPNPSPDRGIRGRSISEPRDNPLKIEKFEIPEPGDSNSQLESCDMSVRNP
jgi:hypothetical protein